jgi:hypothetical protein
LQTYGPKQSQEVAAWLQESWQQQHDVSLTLDQFVDGVISRELHVDTSRKLFQTFLQYARHEANVEYTAEPFVQQLGTVFDIVHDQRRQAVRKAATVSRAELLWDGGKVQHADFVQFLGEHHSTNDGTKDRNPPELRLMNLEAERMLRASEGTCTACTRILSVSKVKGFGKDENDDEVCFNLLLAESPRAWILSLVPLAFL